MTSKFNYLHRPYVNAIDILCSEVFKSHEATSISHYVGLNVCLSVYLEIDIIMGHQASSGGSHHPLHTSKGGEHQTSQGTPSKLIKPLGEIPIRYAGAPLLFDWKDDLI